MSSAPLAALATAMVEVFSPLDRAFRDPGAFRALTRAMGWDKEAGDALGDGALGEVAESLAELIATGRSIAQTIEGPADADRDALVDDLFDVAASLRDLVAGLEDLDTDDLPSGLDDPAFWSGLALDLPEHLLVRYLEHHQHVLYGLLRVVGVIEDEEVGEANGRPAFVRRRLTWDHLLAFVGGPADHLQGLYNWDDSGDFDHARLLDELALLAATTGVRFERLALRPSLVEDFYDGRAPSDDVREAALPILRASIDGAVAEQGVLVAPVPETPRGAIDGLYVTNISYGQAVSDPLPLTGDETWKLIVTGTLNATGVVGAEIHPGAVELVAESPEGSAELAVEGVPPSPWRLLGSEDAPLVEVGGLRVALIFTADPDPDLTVSVRALPTAERGGIAVTIDPAEGDGFVQRLMPVSVRADADPDFRWSALNGVSLGGTGSLDVYIPIEKSLGPVTVDTLHLGFSGGDGTSAFLAAITGGVSIPPLDVLLVDVGFEVVLDPEQDTGLVVGGLGLSVRFKPPLGVGLALEIGDAVEGGGFIGHEPGTGRYYGYASVSFAEYGLGALFVIDTKLPGEPSWALFASISGTWPGIPLGFGFLLTGVGGILALNRTMSIPALAEGLKSGAADVIMFPDDPLGDSALIVRELDAWFPIADGNFVFGIAAQIAWGAKSIVTAELGIAISFPDLDIVVLGTVTSILPEADDAVLELHMDTLGVIDLSEGTVWITSALYDSSLLETLHLSGESAMYARFTADPFFLLSVGGYHPAFQPPGGLPGPIYDLDRMRASIEISDDVVFALETYVAITSNTFQFGSHAYLEASSKFLGVTYTARGDVSFDVLLVFSPFSFTVDLEVSVAITAGSSDHELLAVSLYAHLEGPKPWACSGHARFTFLGIDVGFEFDVGGNAPAEAPPTENVLVLVAEALGLPAAWRPVAPGATPVVLAEAPVVEGEVWASPDSDLEVVQDVAPLDRELDHFGAYEILGPRTLSIEAAAVESAGKTLSWTARQDYFAPAQFDEMTRVEKLGAPSYEAMNAGVTFGIGGIALPAEDEVRSVTTRYEREVIDGDATVGLTSAPLATSLEAATFGHIVTRGRGIVAETGSFAITAVTWATADPLTGHATGTAGTYREMLVAQRAEPRGSAKVAPRYATRPVFDLPRGPLDDPIDIDPTHGGRP